GKQLWEKITAAGLKIDLRYLDNSYHLPCFHALLVDPEESSLLFVNGGYACHPHREKALTGAILEAVQSRLSVIHGGRDDLAERAMKLSRMSPEEQQQDRDRLLAQMQNTDNRIAFTDIPGEGEQASTLTELWEYLVAGVCKEGLNYLFVVPFTDVDAAIQ